jgi:phage shock protein PspC (stress-responsive transcriptional regulator)
MNISDEIKRLHELHQAGALSDAEFEQAKAKLLAASVNLNKSSSPAGGGANLGTDFNNLRRSRSDRWLAGVCGGLARVTGLESWVWRLVFALLTLFTFFTLGVLVYLLMWIFVPEE